LVLERSETLGRDLITGGGVSSSLSVAGNEERSKQRERERERERVREREAELETNRDR
jgi:hypothetical protein